MAYKDKEAQRRAQRDWVRQKRAESKGSTQGSMGQARGKDIRCFEDLPRDVQRTIDKLSETSEEKVKRTAAAIHYQHLFPNRYEPVSDEDFTRLMATANPKTKLKVSKPGDEDYDGVCLDPKYDSHRIGAS